MTNLVVYYSLSGTTRKLAEHAAADLGADLLEIRAPQYRPGFMGFLRAGFDSWRGRLPKIEISGGAPDRYDLVLLMAPLWAGHAATPMRAYLALNRGKFKRAAFVLSYGGKCPPRAFAEMAEVSGANPEAALALREKDSKAGDYRPAALATFLRSAGLKKAA